ncbi:MAG: hypothetical protein NC121_18370 [Blautia sp.]|nr:hypothetical protein [Blautia sp.]
MEYKTYPCEVKFRYLVQKGLPVMAGFQSEKDAADYALSIGGTVVKAAGNPRNAGRIPVFSDREKDAIRERISQGIPMRRIAEEFRCSVGYVHKLKCEQSL